MVTHYKNLIGGEMVGTDRWLDVVNPATEQVIGQVPACGQAELDRAVAAARAAFKTWKNTSIEERRAAILAISGAIKANAEELYRLLTSEQGKPHDQAKGEIYGAAGMSAAQSTLSLDDEINEDSDARLSRTRRVPVGVVAGICPACHGTKLRAYRLHATDAGHQFGRSLLSHMDRKTEHVAGQMRRFLVVR